jgi:4-hydroxybenzoate polyprenyltransferase
MPSHRKLLLLLASVRFANLPSVVSNVWLGVALGVWAGGGRSLQNLWLTASLLTLAGLALYISGNFLNDWHDRHWDAKHRPERALPQGAFSPTLYLTLAVLFAAAGVALACLVGLPAGVIAALIVLCILGYTRWHKTGEWTVILMGLCRGLLPWLFLVGLFSEDGGSWLGILGFCLIGGLSLGFLCQSLGLTLYIVALSQTARRETQSSPRDAITYPLFLLLLAGFSMTVIPLHDEYPHAMNGLLIFAVWLLMCFTKFRQPISARVSALLAGLPLLDWVGLLPISLWVMDIRSGDLLEVRVALVSLLLPPLAFIAGRLLQRLTPAT